VNSCRPLAAIPISFRLWIFALRVSAIFSWARSTAWVVNWLVGRADADQLQLQESQQGDGGNRQAAIDSIRVKPVVSCRLSVAVSTVKSACKRDCEL